jgi:RHS repeat-associated protein
VRGLAIRSFVSPLCVTLITGHLVLVAPLLASGPQSPRATPPTPPKVTVNRTVPAVRPAPLRPVFSDTPTDAELFRARIFDEPLVPVGGATTASENAALARSVEAYVDAGGGENASAIVTFLSEHGTSPWRASLLTGLGIIYRRTGHFSLALRAWEEAWSLGKETTEPRQKNVADRAIGELFELNARLGRFEVLEKLFTEIDGRDVRGAATEKVSGARQALWLMHNRPGESFRCGPLALNEILRYGKTEYTTPKPIELCLSTQQGTSLLQLREVAASVGLKMRIARRQPGAPVLTPAVIHWKVGHFAALVATDGDRYLVRDPTFGDEIWVRKTTIDEEASGYFLVPSSDLGSGWTAVVDHDGAEVWGKGVAAGVDPTDISDNPECPSCGGGGPGGPGPGFGMTVASIHMMLISIRLKDTPVGYAPPVGPAAYFRVTYNQRETFQPQTFSYTNVGPKWTLEWLSYVEDDPGNPSAAVTVYLRNGGRETSSSFDSGTQSYAATVRNQAIVKRTSTSPIQYERKLPDGSVEVFGQPDGALTYPRKVFLTAIKDPQGNALTFTWDQNLRLVAATDALGQVTTITYEGADPLQITKVTDPFGRFATFDYDAGGRLQRITDVVGLQSSFTYGTNDVVKTQVTPYGTTTFTTGEMGIVRWAEMTDPLGGKERVWYGFGLSNSDPPSVVPTGMSTLNVNIDHHNTLYWGKRAMAVAPGEASSATDIHWALVSSGAYQAAAVPLSVKRPLENRVWYNYKGGGANTEGTVRKVTAVGRVLDDGTTQLMKSDYNSQGQLTKRTDPLGRETLYEYDANNQDLLRVKQKNGAGYDLLETRTYSSQHQPLTVTDAAGQPTTYTYNPQGQVLAVTNAKNETTTYGYDSAGYLTSITGPVTGAVTTFTYDGYGRMRTMTDADTYTTTTDYDLFDRPTLVTYPDGTNDETLYRNLEVEQRRDRLGRWTRYVYDATRRLTSVRDPLGRVVTQEWCTCGSLEALVDANGNRTKWDRDIQGRVTAEVRANGATTQYLYEATTSRLKRVTDAKDQKTGYAYNPDNTVQQLTYTDAVIATPSVAFTYDSIYRRVLTMVDGTGTTAYGYHAVTTPPALGATQLASVDGPLANDTITYTYDELGRVTTRAINGAANTATWAFDALGRVTTEANVLGTFVYAYDGPTGRLATVTYPNNQTSTYSYYGNTVDRRLQTIHHKYPNGSTLSKFDYTYDVVGNILTWRQQADTNAVRWEYGYDTADQLVTAVKKSTDPTPAILSRYAYAYDPAGNRLVEQIDDQVTGASYNNVNELVSQQPAGLLHFEGTVNEPATVTIGGKPATVSPTNAFTGSVPIAAGTNTVSITATDASGNSATKTYQTDNAGATKTLTYDANGNMTSDGTRTFEWDARDQLVAVTAGPSRTEYAYDGWRRRSRAVDYLSGTPINEKRFVWIGKDISEERSGSNSVIARVQASGVLQGSTALYYTRDHLGSVYEATDSAATPVTRNAYDPFGYATRVFGNADTGQRFQGYTVGAAGLLATRYRIYAPELANWLSADPLKWYAGDNFYSFVRGNPINLIDIEGLTPTCTLVSSRLLLSVPKYMNKKNAVFDWVLDEVNSDPTTPINNGPTTFGTVIHCMWSRLVISAQVWTRIFLDTYRCTECGQSWTDRRFRTEDREWETSYRQYRRTDVFLPVILDAILDPESMCNKYGRPGRL